MATVNLARSERAGLCDLFAEVGPDAPTLCEGWTTHDLAVHLIVRERRPDAGIGIVVPFMRSHAEKVMSEVGSQPWEQIVATVRSGPPAWSPLAWFERFTNSMEYFVHHEDVRRAQPEWSPRELSTDTQTELWSLVRRSSKLFLRKAPAGVTLATADDRVVAHKGEPQVVVSGPAAELTMFVFGRQSHARVDLDGPADAVDALRTASFGV